MSDKPSSTGTRVRRWPLTLAPVWLGLALVAAWFLVARWSGVRAVLLPGPGAVGRALVDGLVFPGHYWPYLATTFDEAFRGCLVGSAVALPLAVVIVHSRWVSAAVTPFLGATQAIPAVALAPLLVLWVGYGLKAIVALCALMVFFPILVSAVVGLRTVDRRPLEAASLDGAGFWARLWHFELPLAAPTILAGTRNGFTLSITGAVVGEMVIGGPGLGQLVMAQQGRDTPGLFASVIIMALAASAVYSLITWLEKKVSARVRP
ncbi:MAG: ABC transporter permease [Propionibacteriaceae bacterium]|jgi:NitT/TauT family transport system permease protein|nr:ABC transporter permease [Propionibacteriaceae bacterium]